MDTREKVIDARIGMPALPDEGFYNERRAHHGYRTQGRTPLQTFTEHQRAMGGAPGRVVSYASASTTSDFGINRDVEVVIGHVIRVGPHTELRVVVKPTVGIWKS